MTEPFIPTGREFDNDELPTLAQSAYEQNEVPDETPVRTAVHEFVMTVSKLVDDRRGGRNS